MNNKFILTTLLAAAILFMGFAQIANATPINWNSQGQGTLIDGMNSTLTQNGNWTIIAPVGANPNSIYVNTTNPVEGNGSISFTISPTSTHGGTIGRPANINLNNAANFYFWFYINNASQLSSSDTTGLSVLFYTGASAHFTCTVFSDVFQNGWTPILIARSDCTPTGAASWNNNVTQIRFKVALNKSTTHNVTVNFDNLRQNYAGGAFNKAQVILTFDGSWNSTLYNATPIMEQNHQSGVAYIVTNQINENLTPISQQLHGFNYDCGGTTRCITTNELQQLYADGWDVASHTVNHANLVNHTSDDYKNTNDTFETANSFALLEGLNFTRSANIFAYPNGMYNNTVISMIQMQGNYITARAENFGVNQPNMYPNDPYNLSYRVQSVPMTPSVTALETESYINSTIAQNGLLVLTFHVIQPNPQGDPTESVEYSTANFTIISNYLEQQQCKGLLVVTNFSAYYSVVNGQSSGFSSIPSWCTPKMLSLNASTNTIGMGQSVQFTNTSTFAGKPTFAYQVNGNNYVISGNSIKFNSIGSYIVTETVQTAGTTSAPSNPVTITVTRSSSALSISCAQFGIGQSTSCNANVSGFNPTGTVVFTTNSQGTFGIQNSCTLSNGSCNVTYGDNTLETSNIFAQYLGDSNNAASNATSQVTDSASVTLTSVSCPSFIVGQTTTCTASVSGFSPTGDVAFSAKGSSGSFIPTSCILSSGTCNVLFGDKTPEISKITASYSGDVNNIASKATNTITSSQISTQVSVSCPSFTSGQSTVCTVSVSGSSPTGKVSFTTNSTSGSFSPTSCTLASGLCTVTYSDTINGTVQVSAKYAGDSNNLPAAAATTIIISQPAPAQGTPGGSGSSGSGASGGSSGGSGGGGGGGGGGSSVPIVSYQNSCAQITNVAVPNSFSFHVASEQFTNAVDNYIGPDYTSVIVNGQTYILKINSITPINGTSIYMELTNVSYEPILHSVTIIACPTLSNQTSSGTSKNTTVTGKATTSGANVNFTLAALTLISVEQGNTTKQIAIGNISQVPPAPNGLTIYSAAKITGINQTTVQVNAKFVCGQNNIQPYILNNGTWTAISPFTVNQSSCTVSFTVSIDPIVGFMYQKAQTAPLKPTGPSTSSAIVEANIPLERPIISQAKRDAMAWILVLVGAMGIVGGSYSMSQKKNTTKKKNKSNIKKNGKATNIVISRGNKSKGKSVQKASTKVSKQRKK